MAKKDIRKVQLGGGDIYVVSVSTTVTTKFPGQRVCHIEITKEGRGSRKNFPISLFLSQRHALKLAAEICLAITDDIQPVKEPLE
jgi:hypothetical protein